MHFLLSRLESLILGSPTRLITLLIFCAFIKIGIWYIPNLELSQALARYPFANPFTDPKAHYLFWNWLSPFIAYMLGLKTWLRFFLLHLSFAVFFIGLFLWHIYHYLPKADAQKSALLFFVLPVSGTAFFWVGPDALTLLLWVFAFISAKRIFLVLIVGWLLGMQHFEQSLCAALALLIGVTLSHSFKSASVVSRRFCVATLLGIIFGKITLIAIVASYEITVNAGRTVWLEEHFWVVLSQFGFHFQLIVWSTLGLGWLAILKYCDQGKSALALLIPLLGLILLVPFVQDQTRVLALVSFPLLFNFVLLNPRFLNTVSTTQASLFFLLWLILPWGWVFAGRTQGSVLSYDMVNLLHRLFGWFTVPEIRDYWPFYW